MNWLLDVLADWRRASVLGLVLGLAWILVFRVPPLVLADRSLTVHEVLGNAAGLGAAVFVALWLWAIGDVYPHARDEHLPRGARWHPGFALVLLVAAGFETAIVAFPRTLRYLLSLPAQVIRR